MRVGCLVTLKQHCKSSGRMAIITEVPDVLQCVKIMFLDTYETKSALLTNLIIHVEENNHDKV